MTQDQAVLIYLLASALGGIAPQAEYIREADIPELAAEAKKQNVSALCFSALSAAGLYGTAAKAPAISGAGGVGGPGDAFGDEAAEKALAKLRERKDKAVRKIMLLDSERAAIFRELDRMKIWYLPLKGIGLKSLYPGIGMREMSDNDILIDPCGRERVHELMLRRGYTALSNPAEHHDVYRKQPIYNFEMHVGLIGDSLDKRVRRYFDDISDRLTWTDSSPDRRCFEREMTCSDEYVYFISHAYGHYISLGTGIRTLCDAYLIDRARGGCLDEETAGILRELELDRFESLLRRAAVDLFDRPISPDAVSSRLDAEESALIDSCFSGGVHGSIENGIMNDMQSCGGDTELSLRGKLGYIRRRIFPPVSWYRQHFPYLDKHPYMIPLFALRRLTVKAFGSRHRLKKELEALGRLGDDSEKKR